MSPQEIKELTIELQEIGLSEKEARVYLATLELGQETVQNISKAADVNRATTYVILGSLQKKGIVTVFEQGKKTVYIAEGPTSLYNIIREQQEELEKKDAELDAMMPQLMSAYNLHPDKPKVTFYEGKEGLKQMIKKFFVSGASNAIDFYSYDDLKNVFSEAEIKELGEQRRYSNNIGGTAVFTSAEKQNVRSDELTKAFQIPEDLYKFQSDIIVYNDVVWAASLKGHISGIMIESKPIADTMRSILSLATERAKEINIG